MASGPQKPDHGGNFYMVPRRVQDSMAWKNLSMRARVVLQVFQFRHDGYNNGQIGLGIHDIGKALGDQNHRGNSRAVAELIEKGFLEITSDFNRHQSKVRTYRITFISMGESKRLKPATHEYASWQPADVKRKKFGGARTATQTPVSVAVTTTMLESSVADTTTPATGTCGFEGSSCVAVTTPLIGNQSVPAAGLALSPVPVSRKPVGPDPRTDLGELRAWAKSACAKIGLGAQRALAKKSGVPEATLSRFLAGKGLPDHHRIGLQHACGHVVAYSTWQAAKGPVHA